LADVRDEAVSGTQCRRELVLHARGIAKRRELRPDHPAFVLGDERASGLDREAGLPGPARPGQCEQAGAGRDARVNVGELSLPPDERARRQREVRARDRHERRETHAPDLEDPHGLLDVFEAVLAELHEPTLDERGCRLGEQDLSAVARGGDPRGEVDVLAHVARLCDERRPRVRAHSHPDRAGRERRRDLLGRLDCAVRRREREEERVALRVDLHPVLRLAGAAHDTPVRLERLRVALVAELAQQPRRALDVREEKRDGPARKVLAHPYSIAGPGTFVPPATRRLSV
jgi:hypothetical protein